MPRVGLARPPDADDPGRLVPQPPREPLDLRRVDVRRHFIPLRQADLIAIAEQVLRITTPFQEELEQPGRQAELLAELRQSRPLRDDQAQEPQPTEPAELATALELIVGLFGQQAEQLGAREPPGHVVEDEGEQGLVRRRELGRGAEHDGLDLVWA